MKPTLMIIAFFVASCIFHPAGAGEKATPREAYAKVTAAANYLSKAGEDGIGSLGDPKKGFIWKDSSVWVARCESNSCLPNPRAKANRVLISETKCYKTGKLYILDLCDRVEDPGGAWTTYYWRDSKTNNLQRKAAYMRQVKGQPFQVIASVFDETTSIGTLEKISKK